MYFFYLDDVLLPIAPPKMQIKINNQNKTMNLINEGEINILKLPGLSEFSFTVLLPMFTNYPMAYYPDGFKSGTYYLDHLKQLKNQRKVFTFRVLRYVGNGFEQTEVVESDTNTQVSLESYTITEDVKNGFDFSVDITLKQYSTPQTYVVGLKATDEGTVAVVSTERESGTTPTEASKAGEYTVQKDDNLWAIAKKHLGDGNKHTELYKLNADTIEAAAKARGLASSSNGHWIFPGTVLKIS